MSSLLAAIPHVYRICLIVGWEVRGVMWSGVPLLYCIQRYNLVTMCVCVCFYLMGNCDRSCVVTVCVCVSNRLVNMYVHVCMYKVVSINLFHAGCE